MRRNLVSFSLLTSAAALMLLSAQTAQSADLSLFQRYYGTIDFYVKGTGGIRGTGKLDPRTGQYRTEARIDLSAVPENADLLGIIVYWQSLEKSAAPSSAQAWISYSNTAVPENPNDPNYLAYKGVKVLGKPLGAQSAAPCWSNGGSTGTSKGAPTLRNYRGDFLRYAKDPRTGKLAKELFVRIQDSGSTGNGVPLAEGASVVLILRHPAYAFKSIVIFDGAQTMDNKNDSMSLDMNGFYQASPGEQKVAHIVGNGQTKFGEILKFNGQTVATDPFKKGWDDETYPVTEYMSFPQSPNTYVDVLNTTVTHGNGSFDCLSWGAVVFSTTVQDTDEDGLLDVWEKEGYKDFNTNQLLVDLPRMGASPTKKDLFIEIDYMREFVDDSHGQKHSHLPKSRALRTVADALKFGKVDATTFSDVNVHFDVGDPSKLDPGPDLDYLLSNGMLITNNWKGGNELNERWPAPSCPDGVPGVSPDCLFRNQPGLISWKGLQHVRNNFFGDVQVVNGERIIADDRYFFFHYVVFGHGQAIPTILPTGEKLYQARSVSGRAQLSGNTAVVTLGLWNSSAENRNVGSADLQGAVLLHEVGHTISARHGGVKKETTDPLYPDLFKLSSLPNCNNKQSSMSYLYLSGGMKSLSGAFNIGFSGEVLEAFSPNQNENALNESQGLFFDNQAPTTTPFLLRWYAPIENVKAAFRTKNGTPIPLAAAKRHCDGTPILESEEGKMIRVDNQTLARFPIDWDFDKSIEFPVGLDLNFNGKEDSTESLRGFNDWESIFDLFGLQQVSISRNVYGLSLGVRASQLLRFGEDDLGEDDLGEDDLGEDDLGEDDLGEDDLGEDDLGEDDLGEDDLGENDEIDETIASDSGGNGPLGLSARVANGPRRVELSWSEPAFGGQVLGYVIYRAIGTGPYDEIGSWPTAATPQNPFVDRNVQNNQPYRYVVIAEFAANPPEFPSPTLSNPSNEVSVTP